MKVQFGKLAGRIRNSVNYWPAVRTMQKSLYGNNRMARNSGNQFININLIQLQVKDNINNNANNNINTQ